MSFCHGFGLGQANRRCWFDIKNDTCLIQRVSPKSPKSPHMSSRILPRALPRVALLLGIMLSPVFTQPAIAQIDDVAAAIKIGESDLTPTVRFDYFQTNNAFLTNPDQAGVSDPTEATAFLISPRVEWQADRRLFTLTGIYEGAYASYSESQLNYADHSLRAIADAQLSSRQRLRFRAAFDFAHQPLGTGFTLGIGDDDVSQVEFINTILQAAYTYGAAAARGNVQVGLNVLSRSYQNQAALTNGAGYTAIRPFGVFALRLSSDTRAITTVRFGSFIFDNSNLDRNDLTLLTGLRFAATGKFGGEFQVGASLSEFELASRVDQTSFIAEAELFYEPTTFSRFELIGSRELENDSGSPLNTGTVLAITDEAKLNWQHEWSSRLFHVANLSYRVENGDCPESGSLTEFSGRFEMNLVLRRWLHVGASFAGQTRESTQCAAQQAAENVFNFDAQIIGAHIRATL